MSPQLIYGPIRVPTRLLGSASEYMWGWPWGFLSVLSMMWEAMLLGQETQCPPHLLRAGFCRGGLSSSRLEAAATIVVSGIPVLASPFP